MRLVIINDLNQIEHIYEANCSKTQIDDVFDEYLALLKKKAMFKPETTLSGQELDNYFQYQLEKFWSEFEYRKKLQERADNWLRTKTATWGNKFKAWLQNQFSKLIKKKTEKPKA